MTKKYIKNIFLTFSLSILLSGCAISMHNQNHKTNLNKVISKSYMITVGMDKSEVRQILKAKPSIIQRFNEDEIWIYEGEETDPQTIENDFYTLVIKFKKGLVISISASSCKVPNLDVN